MLIFQANQKQQFKKAQDNYHKEEMLKQQQNKQNQEQAVKQQQQTIQRWDAVMICSMIIAGAGFCMQEQPSIHDHLQTYFNDFGISDYQFDYYFNLASSISLGILIFYAGIIGTFSDMLKPGLILIIQTFFLTLAQFMVYLSIYFQSFHLLIVGRIVLFVQVSSMFISVKVYVNNHTSESKKGLSMGIYISCGVTTFGLNLLTEPHIANKYGLRASTFITFLIVSLSFILALFCYYLEQKYIKQQEQDYMKMGGSNKEQDENKEQGIQVNQHSQWEQVKNFSVEYWLFCCTMFLCNVLSTVLEIIVPAFLSQYWGYNSSYSTQIASIIPILSLFVPFIGNIVDKLNRDYEWVIIQCLLHLIGIIFIGNISPLIGIILFAIGYNMRISIQGPLLTKLVPSFSLGKAFGILRSLKDLIGMCVFFTISLILKQTQSYYSVVYLLIGMCITIVLFSIAFYIVGKRNQVK